MVTRGILDPGQHLRYLPVMIPRVSILLPVFNSEETLTECLDSLLSQTFGDFEIIAVDDGSTDGSAGVLLDYQRRDRRIKVIHIAHSGIVTALQTAAGLSSAPCLARMDADDISLPRRLEKQVTLLDRRPDIALAGCRVGEVPGFPIRGGYAMYFQWVNALIEPDQIAGNLYVESPLPHPTVMFRREPYLDVGGYQDHGWPEDYDLWLRMHLAGYRFAKVPEELLLWRDHGARASRRNHRYDVEAFFRAKAYYLAQGPLKGVGEVVICGAGKTARRHAAHLTGYGIRIAAYVDVDPGKIGRFMAGVPVVGIDDLTAFAGRIILSFVARWGAREAIRDRLNAMGKIEGKDYLCCA
ncbi:MAG: glycosyltransferase [Thermodesulfobacteriota bacterium]